MAAVGRARFTLFVAAIGVLVVLLPGAATGATALFRVNAGGAAVNGTPTWAADTTASPSQYVNASATGNQTFSTTQSISLTHSSVPAGTPAQIFQSERWDAAGGEEMKWSFPVSPGRYQVRLYFAEIYSGAQAVGARVFNVSIEGATVLSNYDIFADVGGYNGVVKSFLVSSDSTLEIEFGHVVENPKVNAVEILPGTVANELGASPATVDFGTTQVGTSQSKPVQLTNLGGSGDPSIVIESTAITGTNASQFSDSFNDASSVTVAPGDSTTISATFAPTSIGAKSATLGISHSGANTPLNVPLAGSGTTGAPSGTWETRAASGPLRQEVSYVHAAGKLYLAGGGTAHEVYNPATNTWSNVAPLPATLDHIQGVELGGKIYYIGGLSSWPSPEVDTVYIYDPATNTFSQGAKMPRPRGAGGVAVHSGKIYYAGGLHGGVAVPWFDVYDPVANTWAQLPDMPTARDHFHAAVLNGKFYAIGGRNKDIDATTPVNQAYNFSTGAWASGLSPLPTPRGGFAAAVLGDEVLIIGGEGGGQTFSTVEAYNTLTNSWRTLAPMPTARHGIQAAVCNGGVYIAAGGKTQGGSNPSDVHEVFFLGSPTSCGATPVGFGKSVLSGASSSGPTSLEFGPDGRLYVAQQNGLIKAYTISRQAANSYAVTATETITAIQSIPNHNDNGAVNSSLATRQVTGILVRGTAANPVIYVGSSDPRIGGGSSGQDTGLDTNSSMISRLTKSGTSWQKVDLVRGLPRSEENHSVNGLQLDTATNTLYAALGGNTNEGAPSNNFSLLPEFALSAAILAIDLNAIGSTTYDLPTLDDETRAGTTDANDPFGGNDGKNQAKLAAGSPVKVHAPGFRNAYDIAITKSGRMYTIDNGGNAGWGDIPKNEGPAGVCTNEVNEPGVTEPDQLQFVSGPGYYGGHPNPTRGNKANTFNANGQSPVETANPIECDYLAPGAPRKALATWPASTNGLVEYTASNFGGAMKGDLLTASFDNKIYRIKLNAAGDAAVSNQALFSTVGSTPLDVTALGDTATFAGTVWVGDHQNNTIYVFEPNDFSGGGGGTCTGADNSTLDEDADNYNNADEIDNGTNPCSAADVPADWDGDSVSNINDPNDDNDTLPDTSDPFAIDALNGTGTTLPVSYSWDNDTPSAGGLLGLGFTGLMTNGSANYATLFNPANMTAGGAAGVTTVDKVPEGDAYLTTNTQQYGFQFGIKAPATKFNLHTRIVAPFAGLQPQDFQSMGLFLGDGDQDDYLKLVVSANGGAGGLELLKEVGGTVTTQLPASVAMPGPDAVDLFLTVDPAAATVQASYQVTAANGVAGARTNLGGPQAIPSAWLNDANSGLAVGIISTSSGPAPEFPATWDLIEVVKGDGSANDTTAPTVTSVSPAAGATGVAASANVSATFSEPVDPATVSSTTFTLVKDGTTSPVAAVVTYDSTSNTALLSPNANLEAGATYTATVKGGANGVKDLAGNALAADKTWSFTVGTVDATAPTVTAVSPADGATGVAATANVSAVFSEAVQAATVTSNTFTLVEQATGTAVAAAVTYNSGSQTAVLDPNANLDGGKTYTATVKGGTGGVKDLAGNALANDKVWSFTTAAASVPPAVASDSFARTVSGGWGSADVGGAWAVTAGSAANFAVNGAKGTLVAPTGGAQQVANLGSVSVRDVDVSVEITFPGLPSSSAVYGYLLVRGQAGGAHYRIGLYLTLAGKVFIRGQTNAGANVFADVDTGLTFVPGDTFVLRVQAEGASPTALRAKAWKLGATEPSSWAAGASSSTTGLQVAGSLGIRAVNSSGGAMTFSFDNLAASELVAAPDTTAPSVTAVSPVDGATGVAGSASVSAAFSEPVQAASVSSTTFTLVEQATGTAVAAAVTYNSGSQTAVLDPNANLEAGKTYIATVKGGADGVKDLAGNALAADKTWSFTVDATAPTVIAVSPAAGATGVASTTKVTATFSEPIAAATVTTTTFTLIRNGTTTPVAATVNYDSASKQATLRPSAKLAAGATYTASVNGGAGGVTDEAGNPLAVDKVWSFTVR